MKNVTMFMMDSCPYCKKALRWMDALFEEDAKYKAVPLEIIDETKNPDIADKYDYHYVPTFYVNGEKLHEGAASADIIKRVFNEARKQEQ